MMLGGEPGVTDAAATNLLYSGEYQSFELQQQYLRARWYDQGSGRFNRLDPFKGSNSDPQSLHKYAYAHLNPVMGVDPSGEFTLVEIMVAVGVVALLIAALIAVLPKPKEKAKTVGGAYIDYNKINCVGHAGDFQGNFQPNTESLFTSLTKHGWDWDEIQENQAIDVAPGESAMVVYVYITKADETRWNGLSEPLRQAEIASVKKWHASPPRNRKTPLHFWTGNYWNGGNYRLDFHGIKYAPVAGSADAWEYVDGIKEKKEPGHYPAPDGRPLDGPFRGTYKISGRYAHPDDYWSGNWPKRVLARYLCKK